MNNNDHLLLLKDEQPLYKLTFNDNSTLTDVEILSLILFGAVKNQKQIDYVRRFYAKCNNNLFDLKKKTIDELTDLKLTLIQKTRLIAIFEFIRRYNRTEVLSKNKITSSSDAYTVFASFLSDKLYEEFWILLLNNANKLILKEKISDGGTSETVIDPRKLFIIALRNKCSKIIIGHNHPSGEANPSSADMKLTEKIKQAGKLLDIALLDHIIIADNKYYSFADEGKV